MATQPEGVGTVGVSAKGYLLHNCALHCVCGLLVSSLMLGAARLQRQCTQVPTSPAQLCTVKPCKPLDAHILRARWCSLPGRQGSAARFIQAAAVLARVPAAAGGAPQGARQVCPTWRLGPLLSVPDHAGDHTMGICHDARLTGKALALRTCAMSFLHACWLCHLSCCGAKIDWRACPPAHCRLSRAVQAHHPVH